MPTHYTELALELHRQLTYADRAGVLAALGDELGNLRAAWDHWVEQARRRPPRRSPRAARGATTRPGATTGRVIVLGDDFLRVLAGAARHARAASTTSSPLQTNLARTQLAVRGFTPEAERTIREALERFEAVGDARHRFATLRSLASLRLMRSEFEPTAERRAS